MVASIVVVYVLFHKRLRVSEAAKARIMATEPALAITDHKRLIKGMIVFSLTLSGFFLGQVLDVEPGIVALAGGLLMVFVCGVDLHGALGKVEWNTILFFVGLFILIGALQDAGLFTLLGEEVVSLTQGKLMLTTLVILWVAAIASAIVDNIPLVIAMIPLINSIIPKFADKAGWAVGSAMTHNHITYPLFWRWRWARAWAATAR